MKPAFLLKNNRGIIKKYIQLVGMVFLLTAVGAPHPAKSAAPEELQKAIEEKSKNLELINQQISATQENIKKTSTKSKTLKGELKTMDYNIGQLALSIESSQIKIEKFKLEIESINYNIGEKEQEILQKKEAIGKLLEELQEKSRESGLAIFLKNTTLAKSLGDIQNINSFNDNLGERVVELDQIKTQLAAQKDKASTKKGSVETENKNLKNKKIIVEDQKQGRVALLATTNDQEKIYQKQLSDLERQQQALSDQIDEIEQRLLHEFNISLLPTKRPGVLEWPVSLASNGGMGYITQAFGERSNLYRGKPHNGLDIGVPIGSPVYSAAEGVVTHTDNNDQSRFRKYQYGIYVLLEHPNGLSTLYAHLSKSIVKDGEHVSRGQLIGYSGTTGYSTGPHLHLGLYWSNSILLKSIYPAAGLVPVGVIINPQDYL